MTSTSSAILPLLPVLLKRWRGWCAIAGATLLSSFVALAYPWPLQVLIDHTFQGKPAPAWLASVPGISHPAGVIAWMAGAGVVIFLLDQILVTLLAHAWIVVGQRSVYDLALKVFDHVQRCSVVFHSRTNVGDLISRITGDCWCVYNAATSLLFTPAHSLAMTVGMSLILWQMSPSLTLVAICIAPALTIASVLLGKATRAAASQQRASESKIESHVQQTLTGIPVVQSFAQEDRHQEDLLKITAGAITAQRKSAIVGSVSHLINGGITALGNAAVLLLGAQKVIAGEITVGELLVFLAYLGTLHGQLSTLAGTYIGAQGIVAGAIRVRELLSETPVQIDSPAARPLTGDGELAFHDVWFSYSEDQPVIRGVSLSVRVGELVALVGSSGAGKSTLASLSLRLLTPTRGHIAIDGVDLNDAGLDSLRQTISAVLQEPMLHAGSVADNIAGGEVDYSLPAVERAARAAGAHDFISRLDDGYDTLLGESGVTLSGGERQRIAIARALYRNPRFLVLDEPTSSLDSMSEDHFLQSLQSLAGSVGVLLIAHRLSTARHADRILVLQNGQVVEQGAHDELLAAGGEYARLLRLQQSSAHAIAEVAT